MQQVLAAFPGATLKQVRHAPVVVESADLAEDAVNPHELTQGTVAEVEEWDPFEDEE